MGPLERRAVTGLFWLDWAIQAASLFNVILLMWLGLTVLFNAECRTGGILLAGGGLLMGGAFFISHSALLGLDANIITAGQNFWWYSGWALVVCLPFAWYIVILWYTGFWESRRAAAAEERRLYLRQRFGLAACLFLAGLLAAAISVTRLLPPFTELAQTRAGSAFAPGGIVPLAVLYPIYALACMGLSIDALRRPGPSRRWLGELARRRAQPWLLAASLLLLVVSLLVGWAMNWIALTLERGAVTSAVIAQIGVFDLVISGLIGLSVLVMGQAIVSYEIFTARTLPRNGLIQHWRRAVILAAGYSLVVAWALASRLHPIYSLLLATLLMTVFSAMLAWRSYAERERFMRSLRPFLGAPRVLTSILETGASAPEPAGADVAGAFRSLCEDILETRQACLAPLGAMAALAGPPVFLPRDNPPPLPPLADLAAAFRSPDEKGLPLDPARHGGFIWAIPLWSERGLVGALLLGEKRMGGLYSQEEVEMAHTAGERLIDLQASVELARRLAVLERQHLAQNQVLDQQARRVLHDEILPQVHTVLLRLAGEPGQNQEENIALLTQAHRQISDLLRSMPATLSPDVKRLGFLGALRQVVERDLAGAFDRCEWEVEPRAEALLRALPPLESEVLFFAAREALRNAARYGRARDGQPLEAAVRVACADGLRVVIENSEPENSEDGGRPPTAEPGGPSSSGQGLTLHSTLMAVIGGALSLERRAGTRTRVILSIPGKTPG